jgi:hypothetical protein
MGILVGALPTDEKRMVSSGKFQEKFVPVNSVVVGRGEAAERNSSAERFSSGEVELIVG